MQLFELPPRPMTLEGTDISAFIVDKVTIDLLVSAAMDSVPAYGHYGAFSYYNPFGTDSADRRHEVTRATATKTGAMLLTECIKSVAYRYNDEPLEDLPGPATVTRPEYYAWTDHRIKLTPAEIAGTIGCFEYQSCEHPEWHTSDAQAFCHELREAVLNNLPGRDDAPSHWTQRDVDARRMRSA